MSYGVGCRRGSDPVLLWLRCRPAPVALIGPLAWELPHAMGIALKRQKKKKGGTIFLPHWSSSRAPVTTTTHGVCDRMQCGQRELLSLTGSVFLYLLFISYTQSMSKVDLNDTPTTWNLKNFWLSFCRWKVGFVIILNSQRSCAAKCLPYFGTTCSLASRLHFCISSRAPTHLFQSPF